MRFTVVITRGKSCFWSLLAVVAAIIGSAATASAAGPVASTASVRFRTGNAHPVKGGGALLRWKTATEVNDLGFTVLRARRRKRARTRRVVSPDLIAGSAIKLYAGVGRTKPSAYRFFDKHGHRGDRYWIRDVDLSGRKTLNGPFKVRGRRVKRKKSSPFLRGRKPPKSPGQGTTTKPATPIPVVAPAAPISPTATPAEVGQQLAARRTVRVDVNQRGWYHVALSELSSRGLDVSNPARIHLYTGGIEQAVRTTADALEFFGTPVDTIDTDRRSYYVDVQTVDGPRIAKGGAATAPSGPVDYTASSLYNVRFTYLGSVLNGAASNYFGPVISPQGLNVSVPASAVAADTGQLKLQVQGLALTDHSVAVSVNGTDVGTVSLSNQGHVAKTFSNVPVQSGANAVRLVSQNGSLDYSVIDTATLSYDRNLVASDDAIDAAVPGNRKSSISGFNGSGVRAYDVTDPSNPVALSADTSGGTATVITPPGGDRTVYAFRGDQTATPAEIAPSAPSTLHDASNAADLLIVTTSPLAPSIEPLAQLRRSQGLSVKVVDIQAVYDEFSFGVKGPGAVEDFVAYARAHWATPPRYLLMVGDGTADPRNYFNRGTSGDVLPVQLADSTSREVPSDGLLAPAIPVGRLPARTSAQVSTMVGKIITSDGLSARRSALLVSDVSDTSDFEAMNDDVQSTLGAGWAVTRVNRGTQNDAHDRVIAGLQSGPSIVNYSGHGSIDIWRDNLLATADTLGLTNSGSPSTFLLLTCYNGAFTDLDGPALAESLLTSAGGASAVVAASSLTYPGPEDAVAQALLPPLVTGGSVAKIGDALHNAVASSSDPDIPLVVNLFGDPTATLR